MPIDPATLPRLFHGGAAGLQLGDLIEPGHNRTVDGCPTCAAREQGKRHLASGQSSLEPPTGRPDRVYVTSDRGYARFYSSLAAGDLYVVELVGDVERSTEDYFPTWCAPAARVTSVFTRAVVRSPEERARLDQRWRLLEEAVYRDRQAEAYAAMIAHAEETAPGGDGLA
ncbi:hypothetical protein [Streptomyces sp. H27-H5]|uniref:hypothetical protein n=1 Tax=Streptomyces sp. H27-H5 TaxID=2996460 RepID=UPI00226DFD24|nr:hypothetical protein [Streptomyces sp. H27-H5]MCY0957666.1 hypothetical protein [Streptomyces sp. H27-H5]